MLQKNRSRLSLEQLDARITPTAAVYSNGTLTVLGDNQGNNISVATDANGNLQVTERGRAVAIMSPSGAAATTANTTLVVEIAGTGANNTLSTDPSLGAIADSLLGNGSGLMTFKPLNKAPSNAVGSPNPKAINDFLSNPGGKDTFVGGAGRNLFDWEPGTGTDTYIGGGKFNIVLVVGNNGGLAENDSLNPDGNGGVIYSRNNLVPFNIYTQDIQRWYIRPSTAAANTVTIGDLSGTATKRVEVDTNNSTVNAGAQMNGDVRVVVNGKFNTVSEGAGPTDLINQAWVANADLVNVLVQQNRQAHHHH
jgi:hypothetical protein